MSLSCQRPNRVVASSLLNKCRRQLVDALPLCVLPLCIIPSEGLSPSCVVTQSIGSRWVPVHVGVDWSGAVAIYCECSVHHHINRIDLQYTYCTRVPYIFTLHRLVCASPILNASRSSNGNLGRFDTHYPCAGSLEPLVLERGGRAAPISVQARTQEQVHHAPCPSTQTTCERRLGWMGE